MKPRREVRDPEILAEEMRWMHHLAIKRSGQDNEQIAELQKELAAAKMPAAQPQKPTPP